MYFHANPCTQSRKKGGGEQRQRDARTIEAGLIYINRKGRERTTEGGQRKKEKKLSRTMTDTLSHTHTNKEQDFCII